MATQIKATVFNNAVGGGHFFVYRCYPGPQASLEPYPRGTRQIRSNHETRKLYTS
jgi:hypothetical protein